MQNSWWQSSQFLASLCGGGLIAWICAECIGAIALPTELRQLEPLERGRRELCRQNVWYRLFEPLIMPLSRLLRTWVRPRHESLFRDLELVETGPFTAEESLALKVVRAFPWALAAALMSGMTMSYQLPAMLGLFLATAIGLTVFQVRRTMQQATIYRQQVRSRLPFVLELMALMMEAGGVDIQESLRTAAEESRGHPLGAQLQGVLREVAYGKTLNEVLEDWAQRYPDDDVREAVLLISTSVARGTPLEGGLRSLADRARTRRFQRLEKSAEECKVHITWPGMVIMLACLLIVAAPFVLAARNELGM